jgi:hypothetical protein
MAPQGSRGANAYLANSLSVSAHRSHTSGYWVPVPTLVCCIFGGFIWGFYSLSPKRQCGVIARPATQAVAISYSLCSYALVLWSLSAYGGRRATRNTRYEI